MSVASVSHRTYSRTRSLSQGCQYDVVDDFNVHFDAEPAVLSIEEIKLQLYSCFTCGVCWLEDHVCLDCAECGGYSLQRPCPLCDGRCASSWKRDLTMSHACGKARWNGTCQLQNPDSVTPKSLMKEQEIQVCSNFNKLTLGS